MTTEPPSEIEQLVANLPVKPEVQSARKTYPDLEINYVYTTVRNTLILPRFRKPEECPTLMQQLIYEQLLVDDRWWDYSHHTQDETDALHAHAQFVEIRIEYCFTRDGVRLGYDPEYKILVIFKDSP